jgi:hypothetical protein
VSVSGTIGIGSNRANFQAVKPGKSLPYGIEGLHQTNSENGLGGSFSISGDFKGILKGLTSFEVDEANSGIYAEGGGHYKFGP